MKIVTICGSLKFQSEMMIVAQKLALQGNCVFTPIYPVIENLEITNEQLLYLRVNILKRLNYLITFM